MLRSKPHKTSHCEPNKTQRLNLIKPEIITVQLRHVLRLHLLTIVKVKTYQNLWSGLLQNTTFRLLLGLVKT
jgi:hypothetical protein